MKQNNEVVKNLGYIVAFVAPTERAASDFCIRLSEALKANSLGIVLRLSMTYDGFWISVSGSSQEISNLVFKLGKAEPGIQIALVAPSTEQLVGNEVIRFEGESPRSLIRLILGIPDNNEALTGFCHK